MNSPNASPNTICHHLAFEVNHLDYELDRKFSVISYPSKPSEGVRVAMIEHNSAPIELIKFI
ncbi:MAG: hypothetical protein K9H84_06295 [Bacteroidales bacterium]|nr:hypothetical protein [Bacteroidales bacterium]